MNEFQGVMQSRRQCIINSIRTAFNHPYSDFNICAIHRLPNYEYTTFAGWAQEMHCRNNLAEAEKENLKMYVVNYLLCPEAICEEEVIAAYLEVWPPKNTPASTPASTPSATKTLVILAVIGILLLILLLRTFV